MEERFGFRTVEVKPDGIHVNGRKVVLKGINRHSFWPETGRATSASLSRADVDRDDHADHDYLGVSFEYPESLVRGVTWLGRGPHGVWKNRLKGPALGLWTKDANDTETGVSWVYPEFKGYHADLYWAVIRTAEQDFVVVTETAGLFLRLYTPRFTNAGGATAAFPPGDVSFLHAIAPIGNKFQPAAALGPEGGRNLACGDFAATLYFFFGDLRPRTRP